MRWIFFDKLKSNILNDIGKLIYYIYYLFTFEVIKNNFYIILLFLFVPFIPLILFCILLYRYIIKYFWLILDVFFKDLFKIRNIIFYDKIQEYSKYILYDLFFEVLPLVLLNFLKKFNIKFFIYLLINLILKIQSLFLRFINLLIHYFPILLIKFKNICYILFDQIRYIFLKVKVYILFDQNKLKNIFLFVNYNINNLNYNIKLFILYVLFYLKSMFKYFYIFDYYYINLFYISYLNYKQQNIYKIMFSYDLCVYFFCKIYIFLNFTKKFFCKRYIYKIFWFQLYFKMFILYLNIDYIKNILLYNQYLKYNWNQNIFIKYFHRNIWLCEYFIIYRLSFIFGFKESFIIYRLSKKLLYFNKKSKFFIKIISYARTVFN